MLVDAHHHLWNLSEVNYPWLMEKGATRFFGDPTPIQRNYLLDEHISKLEPFKFNASVHVQVGAEDGWQEAKWIDQIATNSKNWKIVQVAFCDLAAPDFLDQINKLSKFTSLRGVRQIIGRAEKEDAPPSLPTRAANEEWRFRLSSVERSFQKAYAAHRGAIAS